MKEKYGVERREGRERGGEGEYLVRGRVFQTHKPVTFNQPWSRYILYNNFNFIIDEYAGIIK